MQHERITAQVQQALTSRIDRRSVLKAAAGVGMSGVMARIPSEALASCETDRDTNRQILVVDFAPYGCNPRIDQEVPYDNADLVAHVTINSTVPEDKQWLPSLVFDVARLIGPAESLAGQDIHDQLPLLAPFEQWLEGQHDHGETVVEVLGNALAAHGYNDRVLFHPIQQFYDHVRFAQDEQGNRIVYADMDTAGFSDALYRYPDSTIVNLSWQVGEVGIKSDPDAAGSSSIEVLGAYRKETALKNLTELTTICNAHEDKLFLCASGNFGDDFGEVKQQMEQQGTWPTNVLLIGEAVPGSMNIPPFLHLQFSASGADLVIDSRNARYNPNHHNGSTVATALATFIAYDLAKRNNLKTPEEIRAAMIKMSRPVTTPGGKPHPPLLAPDIYTQMAA